VRRVLCLVHSSFSLLVSGGIGYDHCPRHSLALYIYYCCRCLVLVSWHLSFVLLLYYAFCSFQNSDMEHGVLNVKLNSVENSQKY